MICMILATVLFAIYLLLFVTAGKKELSLLRRALQDKREEEAANNRVEMERLVAQVKADSNAAADRSIKRKARSLKKKSDTLAKQLEALGEGKLELFDLLVLPGYRVICLGNWDTSNSTVDKLRRQCEQFMERSEAMNRSYYLIASLVSYICLGLGTGCLISGIMIAMRRDLLSSLVIGVVVFGLMAIMGYLPYSDVKVVIRERKEQIANQFPQMISKLTLLVTAGLEVRQAWELSCAGEGILYDEMGRVLLDLKNNVPTSEAYSRFLRRCNNPYVTKLSTAIIQNTTMGNAEIVGVFRSLNDESWMEYKHSARRMGEQIQSKLLIPTILMFLGIIILVIVPMMAGFNI